MKTMVRMDMKDINNVKEANQTIMLFQNEGYEMKQILKEGDSDIFEIHLNKPERISSESDERNILIHWGCKECGYTWIGDDTDTWCPDEDCDGNDIEEIDRDI